MSWGQAAPPQPTQPLVRTGCHMRSRAEVQSSTGEEVPDAPDTQHGQQSAKSDAGGNRPLAQACSRNLLTSSPVVVEWREAGSIEQVAKHMHCHSHEPKDKAGFVDKKQFLTE